jgi:hypothetical protein
MRHFRGAASAAPLSIGYLGEPDREIRALERSRDLMINARKERHRAIKVTDPDLDRTGVEIEGAFLVDLPLGIRSRKDFDANRRSAWKRRRSVRNEPALLSVREQYDIGDSHLAVARKDGLLNCGELVGVKVVEEIGNNASSLAMIKARRWRHNELAARVDLEAFGPIGEFGISADLEPPFRGRSVDRDGHISNLRQKWKKT